MQRIAKPSAMCVSEMTTSIDHFLDQIRDIITKNRNVRGMSVVLIEDSANETFYHSYQFGAKDDDLASCSECIAEFFKLALPVN